MKRRGEDGVALILALAFLAIFGSLIAVLLGFSSAGVMATVRLREQRAIVYAADGATDGAIQYVRLDPSRGGFGSSCPSFSATIGGTLATVSCTSIGTVEDVDRTVRFTTTVAGVQRIVATVIFRDSSSATTTETPVDILSWTYTR